MKRDAGAWAEAIADDAESIAALHDRELTPGLLQALREADFPNGLGMLPSNEDSLAAWRAMCEVLAELPPEPSGELLDQLAADYAAIYLTHDWGASPFESVWLDDDHLTCQDAMFQLRKIYADAGLVTPDWRKRPEDHLVLQLLYIAHAARRAQTMEDWQALAQMLDEHLRRWIGDFAARIVSRSGLTFYSALAVLTAAWVEALRTALAAYTGDAVPDREEIEQRFKRPAQEGVAVPLTFVPGMGPTL